MREFASERCRGMLDRVRTSHTYAKRHAKRVSGRVEYTRNTVLNVLTFEYNASSPSANGVLEAATDTAEVRFQLSRMCSVDISGWIFGEESPYAGKKRVKTKHRSHRNNREGNQPSKSSDVQTADRLQRQRGSTGTREIAPSNFNDVEYVMLQGYTFPLVIHRRYF